MGICWNVWSYIGLTQQVNCYFGLWKESVPQLWWKSCAIPARTLRKCSLKYLIATSVAFLWCAPGGTSSICILYSSCIIVFRASDTSLSNMCFLGSIPAVHSLIIIARYARMSSSSLRLLMGSTSIALLLISTITMMNLFPCCECVGVCPVWYEKTVFLISYTLVYTPRTLCPCSVDVLRTSRGVRLGLVDIIFFLDWFRCTFGFLFVSG